MNQGDERSHTGTGTARPFGQGPLRGGVHGGLRGSPPSRPEASDEASSRTWFFDRCDWCGEYMPMTDGRQVCERCLEDELDYLDTLDQG